MIVLLFFLLLAPAIWQQWITDHYVRAETHRGAYAKTSTFLDLSRITNLFNSNVMDTTSPPNISAGGDELTGYRGDFTNTVILEEEDQNTVYSAGPTGLTSYRGIYNIERRGSLPRPTWTWSGYPFIHSQDLIERGPVRSWYSAGLEASIDDDVRDGLQLGD